MVASATASACRTKFPTFTLAWLMRPEIGARILVKSSWTFRFSSVRAIGFRSGARHVDLGLRVVERDERRGVLGDEFGVALHVALGLFELRLRAIDHGLHAFDFRFGLPAIEREQEVALFHPRAVADIDGRDDGIDARLDRDTGDGRHVSERLDPDRNVLFLGHGRDNGHGANAVCRDCAAALFAVQYGRVKKNTAVAATSAPAVRSKVRLVIPAIRPGFTRAPL